MGRGAAKWEVGHVKFYPNKKKGGGAENVLAMLKVVRKKCPHFKRGMDNFHPFFGGGGGKRFRTRDFPIM